MSSDKNNKNEQKGGATGEKEERIAKFRSFVQYVRSVHSVKQEGNLEEQFSRVFEAARVCDILEYAKLKNEPDASAEKINLLVPALPYAPVSFAEDSIYKYMQFNVQSQIFDLKEQEISERKIRGRIYDRPGRLNEIEIFGDDFVRAILDDLEKQAICGAEEKDEDGMLNQKWSADLRGDSVEVCLEAMDKFYERASESPSAIIMSFREKMALMKSLSKRDPGVLGAPCDSFAGVPIITSRHLPSRKMILAKLEGMCLIGDDNKSTFGFEITGALREATYSYSWGVVIRDTGSAMTVSRKDCCEGK